MHQENQEYHNVLITGFVAGNCIVYLKQSEETQEYCVKVQMKVLGKTEKTIVKITYSLSEALRELAETVAQYTGGFTRWKPLV